ncbi:MAG: ABC transporter ATP-binding protein [Pseudomonadota bacterium]
MSTPVLDIAHLSVRLPEGSDRAYALHDVSLRIEAGRTLCVVGESGSGKSVMATAVMGLLAANLPRPTGEIRVNGEDVLAASPQRLRALRCMTMAMVFQEPMTALNPIMRCGEQVDEVLRAHTALDATARRALILAMFERVRLPEPERILRSYPQQLSGGQRQRIVIAMALILKPALLICDEPTTALDVTTQAEILKLIRELQQTEGQAVLFITHDMGVVADIADDVLVMYQGAMVEHGPREQVMRNPAQAYTRTLLETVPGLTPPAPRTLPPGPPPLQADAVGKTYVTRDWMGRKRETRALDGLSLALARGETIGIVGESGSGKSTFARCAARLIDASEGSLHWGRDAVQGLGESRLRPLRHRVQMVFQDPNRSLNPRRTVGQSIVEGACNFGSTEAAAWRDAEVLMDRVQLPRTALHRYPNQFSGGQRQRIAIARALACKPSVLVADEAVSALDVSVQAQVLALLRELQKELSLSMLFITHDLRVAAQLCDRVIVMHRGRVVEEGATAALFADPQHAYTRALFAASPRFEFRADGAATTTENQHRV